MGVGFDRVWSAAVTILGLGSPFRWWQITLAIIARVKSR
jgi:hypothetical protein